MRSSYATVASTLALVVALGSGTAVAAGLAKNSVGSAQLKRGAVKAPDLAKNSVTGKAVKESTLGTVPSAARVDSVRRAGATATVGGTAAVGTVGSFSVALVCGGSPGDPEARLALATKVDHGRWVSNNGADPDFNVADGVDTSTTQVANNGGQSVDLMLTGAGGEQFAVLGALSSNANTCWADVVLVG